MVQKLQTGLEHVLPTPYPLITHYLYPIHSTTHMLHTSNNQVHFLAKGRDPESTYHRHSDRRDKGISRRFRYRQTARHKTAGTPSGSPSSHVPPLRPTRAVLWQRLSRGPTRIRGVRRCGPRSVAVDDRWDGGVPGLAPAGSLP